MFPYGSRAQNDSTQPRSAGKTLALWTGLCTMGWAMLFGLVSGGVWFIHHLGLMRP
jgi:hypothetical protein